MTRIAVLFTLSSALITLLPANKFPNKLAPDLPENIPRISTLCSFVSFSIV